MTIRKPLTADQHEIDIVSEFRKFGNLYQTTSLIDYSKIEYINDQLWHKQTFER